MGGTLLQRAARLAESGEEGARSAIGLMDSERREHRGFLCSLVRNPAWPPDIYSRAVALLGSYAGEIQYTLVEILQTASHPYRLNALGLLDPKFEGAQEALLGIIEEVLAVVSAADCERDGQVNLDRDLALLLYSALGLIDGSGESARACLLRVLEEQSLDSELRAEALEALPPGASDTQEALLRIRNQGDREDDVNRPFLAEACARMDPWNKESRAVLISVARGKEANVQWTHRAAAVRALAAVDEETLGVVREVFLARGEKRPYSRFDYHPLNVRREALSVLLRYAMEHGAWDLPALLRQELLGIAQDDPFLSALEAFIGETDAG